MASNWVDFASVKQAVTIAAVLQRYQVQNLKKHGTELRGRCPIHQGEGQESFHVNVEKNCFQCFSCKARGNVLDFVAAMEKCSVRDAGLKLQSWFSLAVGNGGQPKTSTPAAGVSSAPEEKLAREETAAGESTGENKRLPFQLQGVLHDYLYFDSRNITKETAEIFGAGFYG